MNDTIKKGDRVRSFDFAETSRDGKTEYGRDLEGEGACYVEGVVEGIDDKNFDCPRYEIRVTRRVFSGKEDAKVNSQEALVYPPVNGTHTWMGRTTNNVELV